MTMMPAVLAIFGNYDMPDPSRTDARMIYSSSESDANMLWATRFRTGPFHIYRETGRSVTWS